MQSFIIGPCQQELAIVGVVNWTNGSIMCFNSNRISFRVIGPEFNSLILGGTSDLVANWWKLNIGDRILMANILVDIACRIEIPYEDHAIIGTRYYLFPKLLSIYPCGWKWIADIWSLWPLRVFSNFGSSAASIILFKYTVATQL